MTLLSHLAFDYPVLLLLLVMFCLFNDIFLSTFVFHLPARRSAKNFERFVKWRQLLGGCHEKISCLWSAGNSLSLTLIDLFAAFCLELFWILTLEVLSLTSHIDDLRLCSVLLLVKKNCQVKSPINNLKYIKWLCCMSKTNINNCIID